MSPVAAILTTVPALATQQSNLRMIEVGQALKANVKFPGSGGCVVGFSKSERIAETRLAYESEGFVFSVVALHVPPPANVATGSGSDTESKEATASNGQPETTEAPPTDTL